MRCPSSRTSARSKGPPVSATGVSAARSPGSSSADGPRLPFEKLILFGEGLSADFDAAAAERVTARLLATLGGLRLRSVALSLPGRSSGRASAGDAMRWFLQGIAESDELDEVVIVDDAEAQRAMVPVLEAARRRVRVVRSASEP